MSWNGYTDKMMKTGNLSGSFILGLEGKVYASHGGKKPESYDQKVKDASGKEVSIKVNEIADLIKLAKSERRLAEAFFLKYLEVWDARNPIPRTQSATRDLSVFFLTGHNCSLYFSIVFSSPARQVDGSARIPHLTPSALSWIR